ncbi:MAG TPA: hypothetical protein VII98_08600 [Solirubrobacteraceae bacterium]
MRLLGVPWKVHACLAFATALLAVGASASASPAVRSAARVRSASVGSPAGGAPGRSTSAHGPDLSVVALSNPPAQVAQGSAFSERFSERNVGGGRAGASTTVFYLSVSRRVGAGAIRLGGAKAIKALGPGSRMRAAVPLTVPASAPARSYFLIGCANARGKVKDRSTKNDCRAAAGKVTVTFRSPGSPGSTGSPGSGPPCLPTRRPTITSTSPSCFDGDAAQGIFVSGLGDDANPGTMAAPKRSLAAGVTAAAAQGKDVYVTRGAFPETLSLAKGVSVLGGYDASWQRAPSNITKITGAGSTAAAVIAVGITAPTTLQLVTLEPIKPVQSGASSYGLRGSGSPLLVLDHVKVIAAPGVAGAPGGAGAHGASGGSSADATGGSSAAGHPGGNGGRGGEGASGADGASGLSLQISPDPFGGFGGPGGPGGAGGDSGFKPGGSGYAGDSGHFGAGGAGGGSRNTSLNTGTWAGDAGVPGQPGSPGHGGGGGGGGGADTCLIGAPPTGGNGGGGGGGGSGGGGGNGGRAGGGSFGIFLANSTGARITDSSVVAADGAAGGNGGPAGYPGAGGFGAPGGPGKDSYGICTAATGARGGKGGLGGPGGLGGDGGGGAGGPSVAIYGISPSAAPGTSVGHRKGGAGGSGGGTAAATGLAADYQ